MIIKMLMKNLMSILEKVKTLGQYPDPLLFNKIPC